MINKHIHKIPEDELYAAYKLFFNTFSSEWRLKILNLLRKKSMNVGEIAKELEMEQSNVSHNLRRLKSCGFVKSKINGKCRSYFLNKETIYPIMKLIDKHMKRNCLMIIRENKKKKLRG
jgi:DNA-binding transcriptional ArsR family regulator